MVGSILAYAAAGVAGLALLAWRFRSTPRTYGSAGWLSVFDAFRYGLFRKRGLMVGDWTGLLPVHYDGTHAITYGAAGSGKGTTVIIPNLLHYRFIFLNDPGGENAAVAIRQWRKRGFAVYAINPFGMHRGKPWELPSHAFNPFDFLDPASETFAADAKLCAEILTPRSGRENGSAKYFIDRAQTWKHASIVHIKTTEPRDRQNPGTMYDHVHLDVAGWKKLLAAMKANPACGGFVRSVAIDMERMEKQASEEFSAVLSTVQQNLEWIAEPKARAAVSRSDVDFSALKGLRKQKGAVIAVILPLQYKETHKAIPRLAMQSAVWEMERGTLAREKVLFEIDEAASLGRIESLPQWLAELRKYRVQWSLQFQNVAQPKYLYEKEWQTFQGNAGLKRFIGVRDPETAKEVEVYCGRCTITVRSRSSGGGFTLSETGRELVMLDEVLRWADTEMIAFIDNLYPLRLNKTPYWNRPEFAGRYHRNPYYGKERGAEFGTGARVLWGRLVYLAAWWLTPHPMAALLILWFVILFAVAHVRGS
ncbi:type IV secretory system conjugative DNA transfer family protein [Vineibacter terrae]|uniref:Type IV secretory system conjugative DNA transfer family protein n=1 Tax=Vineibacter terrae TaxID=2586908 RepID=A0A5C8PMV6_9HYPH|nr:type IV secretory system conjugative DNA transfer family protein [Vineibacter terrae]TXL75140.1 type IV secretory system conjugative DNA transfer family protein [Vineibacter terrae]